MDWENLKEKTLGEVGKTLVTEGLGVGAGFIGASTIGRRIEDYMIPGRVQTTDPLMTKLKGWAYNNVPKLAIWYVLRSYVPETPQTRVQEGLADAKKAIAGDVVFDSLLRLSNHGAPVTGGAYQLLGGKAPATQTAAPQADIQRLIQENSALRTELNKALQRLAAPAPQPVIAAPPQPVQVAPVQVAAPAPQPVQVRTSPPQVTVQPQAPIVNVAAAPAAPVVRYQPAMPAPAPVVQAPPAPPVVRVEQQAPVPPAVTERQRKFAFMPTYNAPPHVEEREKKYGFAGKASEKEIAAMFGML